MEQDTLDKVLGAISAVETKLERKLDEKDVVDQARFDEGSRRFASINAELGDHREQLKDHAARLKDAEKNIRDQAALLNSMSHSTARAVDKALDAQRTANQSIDEARKIVESAIRIHGVSMAAAMKDAIQPLAEKVDSYEGTVEAKIKTTVDESVSAAMKACEDGMAKAVGESVANALKEHEHTVSTALTAQSASVTAVLQTHAAEQDAAVAEKVKTAMNPVNTKVDEMVADVSKVVKTATKTFTNGPIRIGFAVAVFVGAIAGSAAFAWNAASELASAKQSSTPPSKASSAPSASAPADASTDH